jgi:polyisoprenyl-phosphate glycosyltransferase
MGDKIEISIVSPVYMSENLVDKLVSRIETSISKLTPNYEIILVEDGGNDNSWQKIIDNCNKNPKIKGIKLSRNFGQNYALQAGLDSSIGNYVLTMDCDLQDRPEEIHKFYQRAKEGYEIVLGMRKNRQDNWVKKFSSKCFNKVLSYLTETNQDSAVSNFNLYHRKVVNSMKKFNDYYRYYQILHLMVGFKTFKIEVEHSPRESGKSSYSFQARLRLAFDTILNFSDKPLKIILKTGVIISFFSFIWILFLIQRKYFEGQEVQGLKYLALLMSFFSGLILTALGIVGLYVARTFESVKGRPTYIIDEIKCGK